MTLLSPVAHRSPGLFFPLCSQNSILLFDRFYIFAYMTSHEI